MEPDRRGLELKMRVLNPKTRAGCAEASTGEPSDAVLFRGAAWGEVRGAGQRDRVLPKKPEKWTLATLPQRIMAASQAVELGGRRGRDQRERARKLRLKTQKLEFIAQTAT